MGVDLCRAHVHKRCGQDTAPEGGENLGRAIEEVDKMIKAGKEEPGVDDGAVAAAWLLWSVYEISEESSEATMVDRPVPCNCCVACENSCGFIRQEPTAEKSSTIYEEVDPVRKLRHIPGEKIASASLTVEASSRLNSKKEKKKTKKKKVTLVKDIYPNECNSPARKEPSIQDDVMKPKFDSRREKRSLWSLNDSLICDRLFTMAKNEKIRDTEPEYESVSELNSKRMKHITFRNGEFVKDEKSAVDSHDIKREEANEFLTLDDIRKMEEEYLKEKEAEERKDKEQLDPVDRKVGKSRKKKNRIQKRKVSKASKASESMDGASVASGVFQSESAASGLCGFPKTATMPRTSREDEERLTSSVFNSKETMKRRAREKRALWSLLSVKDRYNLHERAPNLKTPPTEYENVQLLKHRHQKSGNTRSAAGDGRPSSISAVQIGTKKGQFYLGAQKREAAEKLCHRRRTFRFYHRIPSKCFVFDYTLIPEELILWIVYRTGKGYHRHFPVIKGNYEKWSIANFPNSEVAFDTFNDLIKYYLDNWNELDDSF
uniref:ChSh domain-containing protein n=2 Tax=Steinernema glaseri TaxID=37863 RepID=A0A1I7Y9V4_9BILA